MSNDGSDAFEPGSDILADVIEAQTGVDPRYVARWIAVAGSEWETAEDLAAPILRSHALTVVMPGRHGAGQVDALFTKSGLFHPNQSNPHHPFLVFIPVVRVHFPSSIQVVIVRDPEVVANYPADTPVMAQWPGKVRSDWFWFTAGDLKAFYDRQRASRAPAMQEGGTDANA